MWAELHSLFPGYPGIRQLIVADVTRVHTSCGFGVPLMEAVGPRDTLVRWAEAKGPADMEAYRQEKNRYSIDGLPAPLAEPNET